MRRQWYYNLQKQEKPVNLTFGYIDKACINSSEPPELIKTELAKINKRHEDMERIQQSIYTESLFILADENLYKTQVINDIDTNIGQILMTDVKLNSIHVN